ncbi:MAG: glycoside hydrolase family 3 C-terminal domain-containing protein [Salinivirgaceae bacterium]|nr:glycoside hydrolase family 3 C-terminal domain-containing protein [Salinivirgaceae bacterium]
MKNSLFGLIVLGLLTMASCQPKPKHDIEKMIQGMTLEEKIDFIGGLDFTIRGYEHLGIPQIQMADGPVGVRNFGPTTAYPAGINLAASFDKEMAYKIGKGLGLDARERNAHVVLGPGMNIYRMPLCGRNFEYLGEDPYLAGQLAKEYIIGMQDQGIVANAKHYVANNQEFNRHHVSSNMDERTLHEIYLPAFKTAVIEGKVASVMTGYNLINDIHASEHDYLNNQILKGDWAFDGFIVSDWVSTYDGLACAKGGLDLEMPTGAMMNKATLIPAIESGELDESIIDEKIRRILKVYERFDFFDNPDLSKGFVHDSAFVRQTALDAARGGMVLLKNANSTLPLKKGEIKTIAVIGPNGHPAIIGGGGSSGTTPLYPLSLLEAVKKVAGNDIEVIYEKGIFTGTAYPNDMFDDFEFYVKKDGKKVIGANADFYKDKKLEGAVIYSKFYENMNLADGDLWESAEVPETNFSARFTCFFTPKESGFYAIGGLGDDGYRIKLDGVEVITMWRDQGPTRSKHDLFMNGGQEYKVEFEYYQSGGCANVQLGVTKISMDKQPEAYTGDAIAAAKKADLVIMAVGFNGSNESESFDRTFEMPYHQSEFINTIAKANSNVVVVLNSGGNVEMNSWIDNVKALLMAWYPGQEGNLAAAEILFGETNPSGKLPVSFEYMLEDNPCYNSYFDDDDDLKVEYTEGIFMGYRYWDRAEAKPRFPFGFGLSYTTFAYADAVADKAEYATGETVKVSVKVKNTGTVEGAEIIQLYVADKECSLPRPVKELKDFAKIKLTTGEEKTVEFELIKDAFAFYNPATHAWEVEPGQFDILIGGSSVDIQQTVSITIK